MHLPDWQYRALLGSQANAVVAAIHRSGPRPHHTPQGPPQKPLPHLFFVAPFCRLWQGFNDFQLKTIRVDEQYLLVSM